MGTIWDPCLRGVLRALGYHYKGVAHIKGLEPVHLGSPNLGQNSPKTRNLLFL